MEQHDALTHNLVHLFQHRLVGFVTPDLIHVIREQVHEECHDFLQIFLANRSLDPNVLEIIQPLRNLKRLLYNAMLAMKRIETALVGRSLKHQIKTRLVSFDLSRICCTYWALKHLLVPKDVIWLILTEVYAVNSGDVECGYKSIYNVCNVPIEKHAIVYSTQDYDWKNKLAWFVLK